jgi:hypothetical protein
MAESKQQLEIEDRQLANAPTRLGATNGSEPKGGFRLYWIKFCLRLAQAAVLFAIAAVLLTFWK